ncbi:MAG: RecB family exonuclease [Phycisphaeraceae bacterium]
MTMIAHNNGLATPTEPNEDDAIEAITGRRHISWSQLSGYRGCPRRWHFSHVEGVEPSHVSSALLLGSAFHDAVQYHFEQRLIGDAPNHDALCDVFHQAWDDQVNDIPIRYSKGEDEASSKATGVRMLKAFQESELASPPGTIVAVEETFSGRLHPELPTLTARVDLCYLTDDALTVLDWKTSRSRWPATKVQESADQLVIYGQLAGELAHDVPVQLSFGVVSKAAKPAVQKLDVPTESSERAGAVISQLLPIYQGMKSGIDYPNPSPMCSGCSYKHRCPAFNHG